MNYSNKAKVVALISGGKDSIYSLMECLRFNHEIICLANLRPPLDDNGNSIEIDSPMYQSVGNEGIELIAKSFDLPLIQHEMNTKEIEFDSMNLGENYQEELKDLICLLTKVKTRFPQLTAVCSGAILSDYQRIRVERVCSHLGLLSFSYLWMRNQNELLNSMIKSQIKAIIIKVAACGLKPENFLGKELSFVQNDLVELSTSPYQINVCGEGGEFESFVLHCPIMKKELLIKHPIKINVHSKNSFEEVAYCQLDELRLGEISPESFVFYNPFPNNCDLEEIIQEITSTNPTCIQIYNNFKCIYHSRIVHIEEEACLEEELIKVFNEINLNKKIVIHCIITINQHNENVKMAEHQLNSTISRIIDHFDQLPMTLNYLFVTAEKSKKTLYTCNFIFCDKSFEVKAFRYRSVSCFVPASVNGASQMISLVDPKSNELAKSYFFSGSAGVLPETMKGSKDDYNLQFLLALRHLYRLIRMDNSQFSWNDVNLYVVQCSHDCLSTYKKLFHTHICCNLTRNQCSCHIVCWIPRSFLLDTNIEITPYILGQQFEVIQNRNPHLENNEKIFLHFDSIDTFVLFK